MKRFILLGMLAVGLLCGCGRKDAPLSAYVPPEDQRLTVYTSHKEEVYRPIIHEFEERTGIWVEVVTGGTSELLDRIEKEQASPKADVMFGGGVETLTARQACFAPCDCDENIRFRSEDGLWAPFSALPLVLIYNTKLVDPNLIRSWADLCRPEFQGQIAYADPGVSGSSYTALVTCGYALGDTAPEKLAQALDRRQLSSSGEVLSAVADGSCLVGITLEETALQHIAAGANIAMVYPADGTSCVPDGTAVIRGARHSENARLFVEFTLSYDVQQLLGEKFYRRSVRTDVEADPALMPIAEMALVDYDVRQASHDREALLARWAAAMAGGQ